MLVSQKDDNTFLLSKKGKHGVTFSPYRFLEFFLRKRYSQIMKKIFANEILKMAIECIEEASFLLPQNIKTRIHSLKKNETEETAKKTLERIAKNADIAERERLPLCQDTGTAVFFVEMGHEVKLEEPLEHTLNRAVEEGYRKFYLRTSIVAEPLFERKNTGNNCPAIVHIHQTKGDEMKITFLPKGGGAENKSILKMLRPADGVEGVKKTVLEAAQNAGGSSCPPWIVGIGIGSSFDSVASLAKQAIIRTLGSSNIDERYAKLEKELAQEINNLKIGTMGFGGSETVLAVHIEHAPTHIASLPIAVNFQCHSARNATRVLR